LTDNILKIIQDSAGQGWVLEPDTLTIMRLSGIDIPAFCWAKTIDEALEFVKVNGYPVAAKVVSSAIMHKSDVGGVVVGIDNNNDLSLHFDRFSRMGGFSGMIVEEMVAGMELIVGAKVDYQFGPVILVGMGGTGVEIYRDTAIRMAPIIEKDVAQMIGQLKANRLFKGYRGNPPVDMMKLTELLITFSGLVMELEEHFESIDLNPVICSATRCIVADARIVLK